MEKTLLFSCILWISISYAYSQDNGLQIEFQRKLVDDQTQTISQILVDSTNADTFQVMCKVNNVNDLFKINTLKIQYKTSANAQSFTDLALMQNADDTIAVTYQMPVMAQGAGSGWTAVGSFDTTNKNGRDSTLGVSRPVSTITCSNAVEYRCHLSFLKPESSNYDSVSIDISKELDVQDSDYAGGGGNSDASTAGSGSAGVIAGAVIGALVAIVIIVLLVYFLWYRRRSAGDDYTTKEEQGASNPNLAPNALYSVPDKKPRDTYEESNDSEDGHHAPKPAPRQPRGGPKNGSELHYAELDLNTGLRKQTRQNKNDRVEYAEVEF